MVAAYMLCTAHQHWFWNVSKRERASMFVGFAISWATNRGHAIKVVFGVIVFSSFSCISYHRYGISLILMRDDRSPIDSLTQPTHLHQKFIPHWELNNSNNKNTFDALLVKYKNYKTDNYVATSFCSIANGMVSEEKKDLVFVVILLIHAQSN